MSTQALVLRAGAAFALSVGFILASMAPTADAAEFKFSEADAGVVLGEIQKPDVTVVISRENLNKSYDLQLEESFIGRIVQAVERAPF